jgi:hypothetical protein
MSNQYPLDRLITCAHRELKMRRKVYPARVKSQFITPGLAYEEMACMEQIGDTLRALQLLFAQYPATVQWYMACLATAQSETAHRNGTTQSSLFPDSQDGARHE